jgi:hypothetical protein
VTRQPGSTKGEGSTVARNSPDAARRARLAACVVAAFLAIAAPARAFQIVTEQEAALPPDELPPFVLRGSPTRRPNVVLVSPAPNAGAVHSPFVLKLSFRGFGGARIDAESIVMTYRKAPSINLNQRLARFITAEGIEIVDAELPPGVHKFRIVLKDQDGRLGGAEFGVLVTR